MNLRAILVGSMSALCLSACGYETQLCNPCQFGQTYCPPKESVNPYWTPQEIKSINTICNTLNAVDSDKCVLQKNWDYSAIQLCRPGATRVKREPHMVTNLWAQVEEPLRTCGHGPLADTIHDELTHLSEEFKASSLKGGERVYSIHDILNNDSRARSSDTD